MEKKSHKKPNYRLPVELSLNKGFWSALALEKLCACHRRRLLHILRIKTNKKGSPNSPLIFLCYKAGKKCPITSNMYFKEEESKNMQGSNYR